MPTKSSELIDAKIERPLLLIPGFAASMLHAYKKHNVTEAPIRVFETFQESQLKWKIIYCSNIVKVVWFQKVSILNIKLEHNRIEMLV
jgi:hypothetical protein